VRRVLLAVAAVAATLVLVDRMAPHATGPALVALERARSGLQKRTVRAADLELVYLEGGTGEPLVLVHGFGADKDNFTRVARHLTPHYRVLAPDLAGFGESSKPEGATYTVAEQVAWLRAFAQAVGVRRPHLGGSSMGGWIATQWAITHPDEVASLWLLGPAGTSAGFDSELFREIERTGRNPLLSRTREDFDRTIAFVMTAPPFMPSSVVRTMADAAVDNYPLHARIFDVVGPRAPLLDAGLVGLATPALVVFGADDRALNPKAAAVFDAAMPNADVVVMDGIGHLPMLEAPAETATAYLDFRRSLLEGRGPADEPRDADR
jgi:pimeloyl-ACP methyl ester carboxylesterase